MNFDFKFNNTQKKEKKNLRGLDGGADVCSKIRSSTSTAWISL